MADIEDLVSFNGNNGYFPTGSLIPDERGDLYGTTIAGGANGSGTVFVIERNGLEPNGAPTFATVPTTLVSFGGAASGTNGGGPYGNLIGDAQGNLYGTTEGGGAYGSPTGGGLGDGTVFKIARTDTPPSARPTTLTPPPQSFPSTNTTASALQA